MNITIHQSIVIQQLRVDAVTNSSVLQIGSAGIIKSLSNLYNTGGFTGPAPTFGAAPTSGPASTLGPAPTFGPEQLSTIVPLPRAE